MMTTHEQMTLTGELEITDSRTMKVIARKITLTTARETRLKKKRYYEGSQLEVTFPAHVDIDEGKGGGPWEPGGYDSRWLKEYAIEIKQVPVKRERLPDTKGSE
ncbi:MAG: hypothetical protein AB9903_12910 [Vulcanimicrobiota bacterium]